ncbi:MAG: XisI protein [Cyanobacteria bacterium P01_C01_bin.120]
MDTVENYREIAQQLIHQYAGYKPSHGEIDTRAVIDPTQDHYEVMHVGWDGDRRVHGPVIHIDIIDGKFWIQYDGTSRPVADALLEAGVPREDIVLAFHPRRVRHYTDFAVG